MPDETAEPTLSRLTSSPGSPERPADGVAQPEEPLMRCPSCGADVVPRPASRGFAEPTLGLACPNCGTLLSRDQQGDLPPGAEGSS
jgi:hypothetical protein